MRAPPVSDSRRGRAGRLRLGPEGQLGRERDAGLQGGAGERLVGCAGLQSGCWAGLAGLQLLLLRAAGTKRVG
jgi:hypothetical protein